MRELLTNFGNLQSQTGASTVGQMSNINHSLGSQMASNGLRAQAFMKAGEYKRQANEAMAKAKVPPGQSGMSQFGGLVNQVSGLAKQFGIGARAPGATNFGSSAWTGAQQGFKDYYQSFDSFNPGGLGLDLSTPSTDFGLFG